MTNRAIFISGLTLFLLICQVDCTFAFEQKSRHATLRYSDPQLVRQFNDKIYLGRSLQRILRQKNSVTVEEEAMAKVDIIIEKAMVVLDMFPDNMHITVVLLPRAADVARVYRENYGRKADYIAYYSLSQKTIYLSVNNANLEVVAHEVGHAVVDHFFTVRPPYNIHELLAQFTAKNIQN